MVGILGNLIPALFYLLFFFVPLVFYPFTSELFEFNKMIFVYLVTVLILAVWLSRCLVERKFIFRRTILDAPLILLLFSLLLSTFFSIDFRTSLLGYYGRFNGGFVSMISYSLLYWAFVSNMDSKKTLSAIRFVLFSTVLVSTYGVLQHFGIDKNIWVQDVQNRVFSTLGQPNWLAAWIVALIPLTWASATTNDQWPMANFKRDIRLWLWLGVSSLLFLTLLYTKSRSGLLGFIAADMIFWGLSFARHKKEVLKTFVIYHLSFGIVILVVGTPWSSSVFSSRVTSTEPRITPSAPALESGGTESGEIRKIVWRGALDLWKKYPILGSGLETFAFAYYETRPVEHNLVSEWDFLYNKAHNEYLNFAATTGTVGIASYLFLIGTSIFIFTTAIRKIYVTNYTNTSQNSRKISDISEKNGYLVFALLSGYLSVLVTNFFGFSVVPTNLLFFLFPAMATALRQDLPAQAGSERVKEVKPENLNSAQKTGILISCFFTLLLFYSIWRYWYSDVLYAKGKTASEVYNNYLAARETLSQAAKMSPNEAVFWDELADATAEIAQTRREENLQEALEIANVADNESQSALSLSPRNIPIRRSRINLLTKLAKVEPDYLLAAKKLLIDTIALSPSHPKLYYSLGLTQARLGETKEAIKSLETALSLRPNFREAQEALSLLKEQK